ncbi:MAG TPA: ATP-dependent zinc metalloprotease FtsH [Bacteroidia bacterium]|nr:ATP-dependent zinc metalloprotease FtsH [Bacteroidia bacterium]
MKDKLPKKPQLPKNSFNFYWIYVVIVVIVLGLNFIDFNAVSREIDFRKFETTILKNNDVDKLIVVNKEICEIYLKPTSLEKPEYKEVAKKPFGNGKNFGPHYYFTIGSIDSFEKKLNDAQLNMEAGDKVNVIYESRKNWGGDIIGWLLPIIVMIGIWVFIMRRMSGGGGPGGQIFNIGKSKAALFDPEDKIKITFKDVAGLEEAKEEIMEIVEFLKNPSKFTKLGGKIPKGALLVGPPGTGKTLLAKAVAGEAGVPFFSLSGSDFVEMFVGVGAARVRDLFNQAKAKSPAIIFIDEIDAVGRSRGKGSFTGGNDERENTLNSLLVEMDGFGTNSGVIILAATNRPDVLDSALLRPGRFDRQISIDKPDIIGREAIFKVHMKPLTLAPDVDVKKLSEQTPGFAGAEIANVCNEAALIAARKNKTQVDVQDFNDAIDRVIGGLEKKNKLISPEEKNIVAYHEAGHAIAGWFLEHTDPLVKVSIVPRGIAALGYAQYLPKEQFLYTTEQFSDSMCMALGGRAAEEIIFERISTGALSDLERITKMAYSMVTIYGMNKRIGNISFYDPQQSEYGFTKPYSESTAQAIDEEVKKIIETAYERTKKLLIEKRNELELVAQELLKKEVIFQTDIERMIGKRPYDKTHVIIEENKALLPEVDVKNSSDQSSINQ